MRVLYIGCLLLVENNYPLQQVDPTEGKHFWKSEKREDEEMNHDSSKYYTPCPA